MTRKTENPKTEEIKGAAADEMDGIREDAREWVVELSSEEASPEKKARFDAWITTDPRHEAAYRDALRVWQAIGQMSHLDTRTPSDILGNYRRPSPRAVFGARNISGLRTTPVWGVTAAAALVLWLVFLTPLFREIRDSGSSPPIDEDRIMTQRAEIRNVNLPDGSVITLGAASALDVEFSRVLRRVVLQKGEAFFAVHKDPARPFVVAVGEMEISVRGTKFDVRQGVEQIRVSVLEGIVEIHVSEKQTGGGGPNIQSVPDPRSVRAPQSVRDAIGTAPAPDNSLLRAGQQIIADRNKKSLVRSLATIEPGAWRQGWLSYQGASLKEVISDANRYYTGQIILASDALNDLKVTASFRTDRIEEMIDNLVLALPVKAEPSADGRIILRPAPDI